MIDRHLTIDYKKYNLSVLCVSVVKKFCKVKLKTENIICIAGEYFAKRDDVIFAYLFGSYATETQNQLSDIDIAVYIKDDIITKSDDKLEIVANLSSLLKTDQIDLVILNQAPTSLLNRIIAKKFVVVDKEPFKRHAFESLNMRKGLDFAYTEKHILEKRYLHG